MGMSFEQAYHCLKQGSKIRRSGWGGYWYKKDDTIIIHTKDDTELDIRETKDVFYTLDNVLASDWMVVN